MANERQQVLDIRYDGYSATPSDYDCPDGQLATALNVVLEDGSLKPVLPAGRVTKPWTYVKDSDGGTKYAVTVIFCHKNNDWVHYIGLCQPEEGKIVYCYITYPANVDKDGELDDASVDAWDSPNAWECMKEFDGDDDIHGTVQIIEGETHKSITAVGNMLIVSTDKNIRYYLWVSREWEDDKWGDRLFYGYKYLGTSVPRVQMEFALKGELVMRTYEAGLTYNSGDTTDNETWNIKISTSLTLSNSRGTFEYTDNKGEIQKVTREWFSDEVTVTLKANTEYCFFLNHDSAYYGSDGVRIFGYASDGKWYIVYWGPINATNRHPIVAKREYTKILVCREYYKQSAEISFRVEEGFAGVPTNAPDYTKDNYDALLGAINSFTNIYATKRERFVHPFFVRYAVRLYSGDYIHVSPPILMRPNSGYVPMTQFIYQDYHSSKKGHVYQYAFVANLQARILDAVGDDWRDIISGVDIFCSQPIYPYNQGQEFEASEQLFEYSTYYKSGSSAEADAITASHTELAQKSYGFLKCSYNDGYLGNGKYTKLSLGQALVDNCAIESTTTSDQVNFVSVAPYTDEEIMKKVKGTSGFYKVASIPLDRFSEYVFSKDDEDGFLNAFAKVDIEEGALLNLAAREALEDEPIGNRTFNTAGMYVYNNRLHLYNGEYRLPEPTTIDGCNGFFEVDESESEAIYRTFGAPDMIFIRPVNGAKHLFNAVYKTYVTLQMAEGDRVVCHETTANEIASCKFWNYNKPWFFYPDNRAKKLQIFSEKGELYKEFELKAHETLNGAYWCGSSADGGKDMMVDQWTSAGFDKPSRPYINDTVKTETSIYVSEVNNPFVFKSANVVTVGATKIIGMASAAKAMSTGQFGQYPLYCFTNNGVWALELASTGVYKSAQPITRDVCISAESITQMDGSVLFATARGIMEVVGSSSECISDNLEADDMFVPTNLPQVEALLQYINQDSSVTVDKDVISFVSFILFCSGCRIIYDYVQQRVIVYNPSYRYAYVYSLKSKTWGMMQSNIKSHFNSYPEALYMNTDGWLCDFNAAYNITVLDKSEDGKLYKEEAITGVSGLVVSRPLKLGATDIYKTVDTMIQRGYFQTGHVQSVLYASNDLFSWKAIWSSSNEYMRGFAGTPYKYFRVGLICKLDTEESISSMTVRYELRLTNRPR